MLPHDPVEAITERITQKVVQKYKISPGGNHLHRFPDLYFFLNLYRDIQQDMSGSFLSTSLFYSSFYKD